MARKARVHSLLVLCVVALACGQGDEARRGSAAPGPSSPPARLVVGTPGSEATEAYGYDGAGNLIEVRTAGPGALTVAGFSPASGCVGAVVSIMGTGFSPVPSENAVALNGTTMAVLASTPTRLTLAVPAGASTGPITVSTRGASAITDASFVVEQGAVIADFTPKMGRAGTVVTIQGSGFASAPASNTVRVGAAPATVTAGSGDSLSVTVGAGVTSGNVSVTTPSSTAVSSDDFFVIPSRAGTAEVAWTGRASFGSPSLVSIPTAGQVGLLIFDGHRGQNLSLYASGSTLASWTLLTTLDPAGAPVDSVNVSPTQPALRAIPTLVADGAYTILVKPASGSTGTVSLTLFEDVEVELDPRGSAVAMTLLPGQNGRCTFEGRPGDFLSIAYPALSTSPTGRVVRMVLVDHTGSMVGGGNLTPTAPGSWAIPDLDEPDRYTWLIQPNGITGASLSFLLSAAIRGRIEPDGAVVRYETSRPAQVGRYEFDAASGQAYTLRITAGATFPTGASITVDEPDGSRAETQNVKSSADVKLSIDPLPVTGRYAVAVTPAALDVGAITLQLLSEDRGELVVNGAARPIDLVAARNGRYTFQGTAGDLLNVVIGSPTTVPARQVVGFQCFRPDGTSLQTNSATAAKTWALPQLPVTGTYVLTVKPTGVSAATTTLQVTRR